ncbi:MAG TPA: hypothetical protein VGJ95_22505 [Pseudonocardiaceae bacterium]|jgi:hypothetical protein
MPWDRTEPHPLLVKWANALAGHGRRAVVVGCGLGADAEYVAAVGYATVAFDIADTAVKLARLVAPGGSREQWWTTGSPTSSIRRRTCSARSTWSSR